MNTLENSFTTGLVLALLLLVVVSCRDTEVSPEELSSYIGDSSNGLTKKIDVNGISIEVAFRPTDLIVFLESGSTKLRPGQLDSLRNKFNKYLYFVVSLSRNETEALHQASQAEYSEIVQNLSFRMSEYSTLTTAQDTIPISDFMLDRTYGMTSSTDLLLAFFRDKAFESEWIQLNLNEFGMKVGNQRFRFEMDDLMRVPSLDFSANKN